jgi:hypothetical protein
MSDGFVDAGIARDKSAENESATLLDALVEIQKGYRCLGVI